MFAVLYHDPMNCEVWKFMAAICTTAIATFLWLFSFKIELSDEDITYRTMWNYFRPYSLSFADIGKAVMKVGTIKYSDRFKPTVRMELKPKRGIQKRTMIINLKIFDKKEMKYVFDFLQSKGIIVPK